jgi:hypothetical protein
MGKGRATEAIVVGALTLGVIAATEQLVGLMGGVNPPLAHAAAVGVAAGALAWLAGRMRTRGWALAVCALGGASTWVTSTVVTLAVHGLVQDRIYLVAPSGILGAACGLLAAPLPDAVGLARSNLAADAGREALARAGVWLACLGALLLACVGPEAMPLASCATGVALVGWVVWRDARTLAWMRRVRRGVEPGWELAPATGEEEPPRLWSDDYFADSVIFEKRPRPGGPYRTAGVRRAVATVSAAGVPPAVGRRRAAALTAAGAIVGLLSLSALLG